MSQHYTNICNSLNPFYLKNNILITMLICSSEATHCTTNRPQQMEMKLKLSTPIWPWWCYTIIKLKVGTNVSEWIYSLLIKGKFLKKCSHNVFLNHPPWKVQNPMFKALPKRYIPKFLCGLKLFIFKWVSQHGWWIIPLNTTAITCFNV